MHQAALIHWKRNNGSYFQPVLHISAELCHSVASWGEELPHRLQDPGPYFASGKVARQQFSRNWKNTPVSLSQKGGAGKEDGSTQTPKENPLFSYLIKIKKTRRLLSARTLFYFLNRDWDVYGPTESTYLFSWQCLTLPAYSVKKDTESTWVDGVGQMYEKFTSRYGKLTERWDIWNYDAFQFSRP